MAPPYMATPRYPEVVHLSGDQSHHDLTGRFVVSVEKWSGGWDLHIGGIGLGGGGVTQVTDLDDAEAQVRKYLEFRVPG